MQEDKELNNKEVEVQPHPEDVSFLPHQLLPHPPGEEPEEEPELDSQDFHNSLIQLFTDLRHHDNMLVSNPPSLVDLASILVQSEARPVRIHYTHIMSEHAPELIDEGKWQPNNETTNQPEGAKPRRRLGVAYERPRSQYDSQFLQENAERLTERFLNALRNADDALNPAAQQGLHVLAESMGKTEGTSLSQLAREHNMSQVTLSRLVRNQLIPILYRDKHTIYVSNETAKNVADLNQKAKKERKPLARLLREIQDKVASEPRK